MSKRKVFTENGQLIYGLGAGNYAPVTRDQMTKSNMPKIISGSAAPTITPEAVGDVFVNTVTGDYYLAVGTSSSNDWKMWLYKTSPSLNSEELTASGAVASTTRSLELNHATVVIAATIASAPANTLFFVKDTSASGTAAHTVTLSSGTWDGTNSVITLNAPDEAILVLFDSNGNGTVISNVGAVVLS